MPLRKLKGQFDISWKIYCEKYEDEVETVTVQKLDRENFEKCKNSTKKVISLMNSVINYILFIIHCYKIDQYLRFNNLFINLLMVKN